MASALFLGVVGGYSVLWVQAVAIILGAIMLAAIGYVTLSTGESPFESMRTRINPVLAWGWILAALVANMVFVLPQYSLAFGALTENIFPSLGAYSGSFGFKMGVSLVILAVVTVVTSFYGSGGVGVRIYETILKVVVGMIVVAFILVVIKLGLSEPGLPLGQIFAGFIPNPGMIFAPSDAYQQVLDTIGNDRSPASRRQRWSCSRPGSAPRWPNKVAARSGPGILDAVPLHGWPGPYRRGMERGCCRPRAN